MNPAMQFSGRTPDVIGTGWSFPIRVTSRGTLEFSDGPELIAQAIWLVLSTPRRSRVMLPEFGCAIHDLVFAPDSPGSRTLVEDVVRQALTRWEPRIDVLKVTATAHADTPNMLLIEVDYRIRANNAELNMVYPLYLNESKGQVSP
ncbi:GPW/gp25 family protein [Glutamicibacter soli]|nr:GPW/gp25 family protein [Glutamicibacter soli]